MREVGKKKEGGLTFTVTAGAVPPTERDPSQTYSTPLLPSLSHTHAHTHIQQLPSHWESWLTGVILLSEITCQEEEGGSCHGQTGAIVEWALQLLEAVQKKNKREVPKVQHAEALLKSRYVE